MDAYEFLLILFVGAAVIGWYVLNAERGSDGAAGLLALREDPETARTDKPKSYRMKPRVQRAKASGFETGAPAAAKTYRTIDEGERLRRRFRAQDEARYRVKDKAAGHKPKPPRPSAD